MRIFTEKKNPTGGSQFKVPKYDSEIVDRLYEKLRRETSGCICMNKIAAVETAYGTAALTGGPRKRNRTDIHGRKYLWVDAPKSEKALA